MMSTSKEHWEEVYSENAPDEVSWYQGRPEISMRLIESAGLAKEAPLVDVGGGASTLIDHLLDAGYRNLSVLDLSSGALERAKKRLGDRSGGVDWIVADITKFQPKQRYTLWHDRAVLHFLAQEEDRQSYLTALRNSLAPGGHLVVATFAIGGPKQCSGLDIVQYSPESLSLLLGESFQLQETATETHRTPWDSEQKFVYCRFRLKPLA